MHCFDTFVIFVIFGICDYLFKCKVHMSLLEFFLGVMGCGCDVILTSVYFCFRSLDVIFVKCACLSDDCRPITGRHETRSNE